MMGTSRRLPRHRLCLWPAHDGAHPAECHGNSPRFHLKVGDLPCDVQNPENRFFVTLSAGQISRKRLPSKRNSTQSVSSICVSRASAAALPRSPFPGSGNSLSRLAPPHGSGHSDQTVKLDMQPASMNERGRTGMNGSAPADRTAIEQDPRGTRLSLAALRRAVPIKMWGGKGCGAPCDFCRVVVADTDVEYEIEAELDAQRLTLHFHPRCHDAWQAGREPPERDAKQSQPDIQRAG